MKRWVPTMFLIFAILTTASGQVEISLGPCTPTLLSHVLASTINSRYDWPDQTVQNFSEQVLRANPLFAARDKNTLLAWHITPRDSGCAVSAQFNGKTVGGNAFYVDLEKSLVFPDDQVTMIYVNMVTSDPVALASDTSQ